MFTININPEILHIFGPFSLHIYGFFVALGVATFIALTFNNAERKKYISASRYEQLLIFAIVVALIGARFVHVISEWHSYENFSDAFAIWSGGLSVLGAVLAGLIFVPLFLKYYHIPVLPIFDLAARYLPLTQAIARLGCLFTGCCFGCAAQHGFSLIYTHANASAPLHTALHPAQLYSSFLFLIIFIVIQLFARFKPKVGQLTALYLILSSLERFVVDFFRGDRIIDTQESLIYTNYFSLHQWLSLLLILIGIILFIKTNHEKK